ncbi:hypothetical protein LMH73_017125 [Vibrio splendidus]
MAHDQEHWAVTKQGRTFLSMQPLDAPELRVAELMKDGSTKAFPTQDWADGPDKGEVGLASVIGIDSTDDGFVGVRYVKRRTKNAKAFHDKCENRVLLWTNSG